MSSLPGVTLESYIRWAHNIRVEGQPDSNFDVRVQEMRGAVAARPLITKEEFKPLVDIYEPLRRYVETHLDDFENSDLSWDEYAKVEFEPVADTFSCATTLLDSILTNVPGTKFVSRSLNQPSVKEEANEYSSKPYTSTSGWNRRVHPGGDNCLSW